MKQRCFSALSASMLMLSAIFFLLLIGSDFFLAQITHTVKLVSAFMVFICGVVGAKLYLNTLNSKEQVKKAYKIFSIAFFIVYSLIVLDFTLVDGSFGRSVSNFFSLSRQARAEYLNENTNIIPFKTVKIFISGYQSGKLSLLAICENLIGNIVVFMPCGYFLPRIFSKMKRVGVYLTTVIISVTVIEFLQIMFLTGSADIDDLILNTVGAMAAFWFVKSKGFLK